YRLSTDVMEALDLEQDDVGEEGKGEELGKAHGEELRALLGENSAASDSALEPSWQSPEDEAALAEADPEESKEPSSD
ncbi:unnamed protein product, partial [Symbiodinium sp. CCMP2456]